MTAEGNKIGVSLVDDLFWTVTIKATGHNDWPVEDAAKPMRGNQRQPIGSELRSNDARFNQVQIGPRPK